MAKLTDEQIEVLLKETDKKLYPRGFLPDNKAGTSYFSLSSISEPWVGEKHFLPSLAHSANIDNLIAGLEKIRGKLAADKCGVMLYRGRTYYQGDEPSYSFVVYRPETDREYVDRVHKEVAEAERRESEIARREREQYKELKKKFEAK